MDLAPYKGKEVVIYTRQGRWAYAIEAEDGDQLGWLYPVPQGGAWLSSEQVALADAARFFPGASIVRGTVM